MAELGVVLLMFVAGLETDLDAGYGLANGSIGAEVFSASVTMVLATTMVTPPLLRLTFRADAAGTGRCRGGNDCGRSRRS